MSNESGKHVQELLDQFDLELPLERARTIPSSWYLDREMYALECRAIFGNTWQAIGRVDQVAAAETFFTADLAGEPIVVVRDGQGELRAFYNVCRHRAARVVAEAQGCSKRLRCPYHGWTYDLQGRLRGTPEFDGVEEFNRSENGLIPVAVAKWGPVGWVHLGAQPPALTQYLAPLPERTANLGLERLQFVERREYRLACNWKVFIDNYLDGGYHLNSVHPGLAGVLDYTEYRTEIAGLTSVQSSPLRGSNPEEKIGRVRMGERAYYWWIFPNFMINIYEGVMDTNLVMPAGPDEWRVIFDFYFADAEAPGRRQAIADSVAVAHQIQLEDIGICEEVQKGLASRSYETGRFSVRREGAGYHFHGLAAKYLKESLVIGR